MQLRLMSRALQVRGEAADAGEACVSAAAARPAAGAAAAARDADSCSRPPMTGCPPVTEYVCRLSPESAAYPVCSVVLGCISVPVRRGMWRRGSAGGGDGDALLLLDVSVSPVALWVWKCGWSAIDMLLLAGQSAEAWDVLHLCHSYRGVRSSVGW